MISALRLTTMLLWLPVAPAVALQVPPERPRTPDRLVRPARPVEPRAVEPRALLPRPVEPRKLDRLVEPRFDKWTELDDHWFELRKFEDAHFEFSKMDMKMDMEIAKLDAKRFEMDSKLFEHDAKLFEQDAKLSKAWSNDMFHYDSRPGVAWKREPFATSPRSAWLQGDPADSLYKSARELLNRGEWRRAATAFADLPQKFPNSGYASDAMYWQAFALYRIGGTEDLRAALRLLETQVSKYPQARTRSDASTLATRVRGTLASRGDASAREAIQKQVSEGGEQACDREDQEVRAEALKALAQSDPASLVPSVRRVLAKKDPCSARLRQTAVYLLGRSGDNEGPALLREVALNDPEPEVRSAALQYLARSPSDVAVNTLEEVLRTSTDQGVLRSAARALASNPNPRARAAVRALIERTDAPERLRMEAVSGFDNDRITEDDATYFRTVYTKIDSPRVKARIAQLIGRLGGDTNDQWLLGLMRNNDEPLEVRTAALERVAGRNMPIADAVRLYGNVADRQMRERLIGVYRQRKEAEATDKLIDIAKNDTDYNLRRQAINALTQKNDPRAMKLLLEIIDK
jgi:HEAT repeat protein/TolA-binding protein